ncbi:MAG: MBL fold metallo-hydrolase [Burkholderiaceae bacterium]|jgi:glyoxylase-like metal-dependent hydrolase (beta-lactamase superfamily II)|nr:MBL fold metallo-hydrolase [Burkholderiaceae bacterium]
MFRYQIIPVTAFAQNCSLLWDDAASAPHEAAVIDPGGDLDRVLAQAKRLDLKIAQIWLTHGHIDHVGAAGALSRQLRIPIIGPHQGDANLIATLPWQGAMFGLPSAEIFTPARWLVDGDTVELAGQAIVVRHCPGHTPGHVVFHVPQIERAFVGDVLFAGSIGRTDLPGGNHQQLIDSITTRLWPMGDATVFIPGHGPESTLGQERRNNPFVREARA